MGGGNPQALFQFSVLREPSECSQDAPGSCGVRVPVPAAPAKARRRRSSHFFAELGPTTPLAPRVPPSPMALHTAVRSWTGNCPHYPGALRDCPAGQCERKVGFGVPRGPSLCPLGVTGSPESTQLPPQPADLNFQNQAWGGIQGARGQM